jgi:hypothetical protein
MGELTRCLELISYKVKLYEERLADGTADQRWSPVPPRRDDTA